jgi:sterol desaturase/sphingolipid hydroxylase (fatty acid hydroxylase superfamily)
LEHALLRYEATLGVSVLLLTVGLVAVWERLAPRRWLRVPRRARWLNNFALWLIGESLARAALPVLGVAFALLVARRQWGVLHQVSAPSWLAIAVSLPALDLARYTLHSLYHHLPPLWRLHRVHHADLDCDVTAAVRFHPLETVLSAAASLAVIALLGVPAPAVLVDQVLLLAVTVFAHANVTVPARCDAALRLVLVTPDMHRVHHSAAVVETDSNLATMYSWWDRLFGTYVAQPAAGHEGMTIGLDRFRERKHLTLPWMLVQPFLPEPGLSGPRVKNRPRVMTIR